MASMVCLTVVTEQARLAMSSDLGGAQCERAASAACTASRACWLAAVLPSKLSTLSAGSAPPRLPREGALAKSG